MEDYLHPLKVVRNKVRGFTGVLRNGNDEELKWPRLEAEGLSLDKIKFLKSHCPNKDEVCEATYALLKSASEHCDEKPHQTTLSNCHAIFELLQAVVNGDVHNGMYVTRATDQAGSTEKGKCYESLALAVQKALETMTEVEKILMVTLDSQPTLPMRKAFSETSRVLHFSFEQESCPSAPACGENLGRGYCFNLSNGSEEPSEADYLAVLHNLLLPVAYEYNPDLVVICGETGNLNSGISAHLTASLAGLAHGKLVVVFECGAEYLSKNVVATLRTLTGQAFPSLLSGENVSQSVQKTIVDTINVQRAFWKCFRFQGTGGTQEDLRKSSNAAKVFLPAKEITAKVQDSKIEKLLRSVTDRVAFIYDERMLAHYSYTAVHHVERPERMTSIYHRMRDYGLIDRCLQIKAQMATKDQICMLHEESYIDLIARVKTDEELKPNLFNKEYDSTSCCPDTYELSLLAAGSAIKLVDAILDGETARGIAVIRPPGHHAEAGASCGFCIFNNTALAAKHAVEKRNLSRVLIVDWDIHHGNGIQRMFFEDPRVLYISIHSFKNFPALPETMNSNAVGTGKGTGYNINIPWSEYGMGDPEYLSAFFDIVLPVAYEFQPELVLVACGFDAARGDPLGRCNVTPEAYGQMASLLKPLANGRLGVILEGGYNLESVSYGMTMVAKALLGDPLPKLQPTWIPQPSAREDIRQTKKALQPYWRCLQFPVPISSCVTPSEENGEYGTLNWCPHLDALMPMETRPEKGVGFGRLCPVCNFFMPNACCLTCYKILCFRECNDGHSRQHYEEIGHPLAFHFGAFKVFCHRCASWVKNQAFEKVSKRAHWERYGDDPYTYPELEV